MLEAAPVLASVRGMLVSMGPEVLTICSSAFSAVVTAWVCVRGQKSSEASTLFERSRKMHEDCEERNQKLEERLKKLETYLFPEIS